MKGVEYASFNQFVSPRLLSTTSLGRLYCRNIFGPGAAQRRHRKLERSNGNDEQHLTPWLLKIVSWS